MPSIVRTAVLACASIASSWAWGPTGHHIVALIAEQRLSPGVKERVHELLFDGKFTMAQVSTCPDALRANAKFPIKPEDEYCLELAPANPDSGPWHYIDIPVPDANSKLDAYCPKGNCITAKVTEFSGLLANSPGPAKRREALMYLIHFMGDIHQPLHCSERSCDQGGNLEHANVFLRSGERPDHRLHRVWDEDLVDKLLEDRSFKSEQQAATALARQITPAHAEQWRNASIDEIAWEGWRLAKNEVYKSIPMFNYCDPAVKANLTPASNLAPSYEKEGEKVVREQLMKAGVRLAALLETALAQ